MILPPDLFKPGAGAHPPHLAGRDGEIQACCERRGDGLDARQVRRELVARGVVWARDGGYEPGIPSLLAHVAECVA